MPICKLCNTEKPKEDFYKSSLKKCKKCYCVEVKKHRLDNIEYYKEYDRNRANDPNRVLKRALYAKTEAGILAGNKAKIKWSKTNLVKRAASHIVNNAVRDNKIIKVSSCESCGINSKRLNGHHDDYAYPLKVRWLCSKCHTEWHKINGEGLNG